MKFVTLMTLLCMAQACYADSAKYLAQPQDSTLSALVKRWAKQDRQSFKWDASFDIPIADFASINDRAQLASATGMDDALFRVLSIAGQVAPIPANLVACHFPDDDPAWVVRDSKQPACDLPLK